MSGFQQKNGTKKKTRNKTQFEKKKNTKQTNNNNNKTHKNKMQIEH